jgi:hypothetical protein
MKTLLSIILIVAGMILIVSCTSKPTSDTEVVLVRDITDSFLSKPKLDEITPLFGLENNQWQGATFRFMDITDVSYNHAYETSINSESKWFSNEFQRRKKVKTFYAEVSQILNTSEKEAVGKDNSAVYAPIAQELNRLSRCPSKNKILLIYSDLMENTNDLSFYDKQKFELLKTNPDVISKYFEALIPLQNLQGIKIFLVFQPNGMAEDEQFQIVSGFYKKLFESKGAVVSISANLD